MHRITQGIILAFGLAAGTVTAAQLEYKGYWGVCGNAGCSNIPINPRPAPSPPTPVAPVSGGTSIVLEERRRLEIQAESAMDELPQDLSVDFRWSEPGENGRRYVLENGSQLRDGDEFTILLQAKQDAYVYLVHFDSRGRVAELMQAAALPNRIRAGETREVPGAGRHFTLDNEPGAETLHLLVAPRALTDLEERYKMGSLKRDDILREETKGFFIQDDRARRTGKPQVLACRRDRDYCQHAFVIHHLPRD